jgi:hypothetical protein
MGVILSAVGKAATNNPQDVISVKALLNAYEPRPPGLSVLKLHGDCDRHTVNAITQFQKEVLGERSPDGLVEPVRPTIQRLVQQATLKGTVSYPFQGSNQDAMVVQALINRFQPPDERIKVDGMFGKDSLAALQRAQSKLKITVPSKSVEPGSEILGLLKEGLDDPSTAKPVAKSKAWDMVSAFAARTTSGAFTQLSRQDVAKSLYARIESPSKLNQGASSLCGAMTLLYFVAKTDPEAYVAYVIDLYEKGEGKIRKLSVKAGAKLRKSKPQGKAFVDPADWVAAASLRDSENLILGYDDPRKQVAGITLPYKVASWLGSVGAQQIVDDSFPNRRLPDNVLMNLYTAGVASAKPGNWVFLLLNDAVLYDPKEQPLISYPTHWVGLLSATINKSVVRLEVFTWGSKSTVPSTQGATMKTSDFLAYYFGHIRCKAP